jgi:hypothetical protein
MIDIVSQAWMAAETVTLAERLVLWFAGRRWRGPVNIMLDDGGVERILPTEMRRSLHEHDVRERLCHPA